MQNNPHVCLVCGSVLARGNLSYKQRHWNQTHKDEKPKSFQKFIVPQDHIDAQKLLSKAATEARQASEPPAAIESVEFSDVEASEMDADLLAAVSDRSEAGPRTSVAPCTESGSTVDSHVSGIELQIDLSPVNSAPVSDEETTHQAHDHSSRSIQTTMNSFFENVAETSDQSQMDKIQDDINKILFKLDELTLASSQKHDPEVKTNFENIDEIKSACNLLDLAKSEKIQIKTLDDGCIVTCKACMEFIRADPHMKTLVCLLRMHLALITNLLVIIQFYFSDENLFLFL